MEDWVNRALARWPNVPALFGWLGLDRRGRWLIRGEIITRPQIIETINRNYAADAEGRWFFQNGPQRGYVALAYAPFVLTASADGEQLHTHTGEGVAKITQAIIDEEGSIVLVTELGAGLLRDADLDWALSRLRRNGQAIDETALAEALAQGSGTVTDLSFQFGDQALPLLRIDRAEVPAKLGFMREPWPSADVAALASSLH